MKSIYYHVILLAILTGCSSIMEGTEQEIVIHSRPEGAQCDLKRNGNIIGHIDSTPASVVVQKTKDDIHISCTRSGFEETGFHNRSGQADTTYGNLILGGLPGWAVDSARGADNRYDSPVYVVMTPQGKTAEPQHSEQMKSDVRQAVENVGAEVVAPIATITRDNVQKAVGKARKWLLTRPEAPQPVAVPASYCYKVLQDVLCYRQPMPGWEHRLVAYQGTYAAAPPVALTRPLPSVGANTTAVATKSQPVFVEMPVEPAKDPQKDVADAVSMDAAHETLPDPASSPQL
jgi:hypothetical protein